MKNVTLAHPKKFIPAVFATYFLIIALGTMVQNIYPQSLPRRDTILPNLESIKLQKYIKDTSETKRIREIVLDSLIMENQKTQIKTEEDEQTVKVQKLNRQTLLQLKKMVRESLILAKTQYERMPDIIVLKVRSKEDELKVNLQVPHPDTLIVPEPLKKKKGLF
jgi:hypothetical protein